MIISCHKNITQLYLLTQTFKKMKKLLTLLGILSLLACKRESNTLAPPMGWNSYDCYGYGVNEQQVRANAEYMAAHLKAFGWDYVVVDFLWSLPDIGPAHDSRQMYQDSHYLPKLQMDGYGRLFPDTARFPSSAKGKGFKPLADYIHSLGLKFGIHLMRGVPRQAVAAILPVMHTAFNASGIADVADTCNWMNHMFGVDMSKPGAQEYYNSLFNLYASWGVDFVKIDDLSNPYHSQEIEGYRKAIDQCGRAILFSTSPGEAPLSEAAHISAQANMWRLLGDLWDDWKALDHAFDVLPDWSKSRSSGHWPDPDMLPLGHLSKYGPVGPERNCKLTPDEQLSLMNLWCITGSPLMFGGNLTEIDSFTLSLLTNRDAIRLDQQGNQYRQLCGGNYPIWTAEGNSPKTRYLAFFNRDSLPAAVNFPLDSLRYNNSSITEIWTGTAAAVFSGKLRIELRPHASMIFIIKGDEPEHSAQ